MGLLSLFLPPLFWSSEIPRLASHDFVQQYPDKKRVYYLHTVLPIVWLLFYVIILSPLLFNIGDKLYFVSFGLGGGLAVGHGLIEILTNVSMRNFSRGGQAIYLVDDSIRRIGWIRMGVVFFSGLIPLIFIIVFL